MGIATSTASAVGTTSVVVSKPSGQWAVGNWLIAFVAKYGTTTVPAAPSGWNTLVTHSTGSGTTAINCGLFYQLLVATAPASYTFTTTSASESSVSISEYSSTITSGPDLNTAAFATDTGTTSTTLTFTSITTSFASEVVGLCAALGSGTRTASGWTSPFAQEIYQAGTSGEASQYVADATITAAGSTGSKTATLSGSAVHWVTVTFSLLPAASVPKVSLGSNSGAAITTTAAVPAGALIVVSAYDYNGTGLPNPRVSDAAGNTYTKIASVAGDNNDTTNGSLIMFYAYNCLALAAGSAITYADVNSPDSNTDVNAFFAMTLQTSPSPLDTAATATAYGSSTSISVTSGTPATAGELFVGWALSVAGNFTAQASGWQTTVTLVSPAATFEQIALVTNTGSTAKAYSPPVSGTTQWCAIVTAFKQAVTAPQYQPFLAQPPSIQIWR